MYGMSGRKSPRFIDQVIQLSLEGEKIAIYDSANLAAKAVNGQAGHINDCLQSWRRHIPSSSKHSSRERFTHKGFYWVYKNDYLIFERNGYDFSQKRNKKSLTTADLIDKGDFRQQYLNDIL